MTRVGNPRLWIVILIVAGIAQFVYLLGDLPETVATDFDLAGRPDGWLSIRAFLVLNVAVAVAVAALFWFIPPLLRRLPDDRFNLPHKDYWLAPERRAATIDWLGKRVLWFGVATQAFLVAVFGLVLRANLANPPRLSMPALWIFLGAFLALTIAWCASLIGKFRVTPGRS